MGPSDRELVESVLGGDGSAFQPLVERYQNLVFNIVFHYMGRREEVEDIAQEVLVLFLVGSNTQVSLKLPHFCGQFTAFESSHI